MGDFNIDLLKQCQEFETSFYSYNLIPTISLATHEKPGCSPSFIDNIFINSSENLINSGTLEEKISHHSPIFCFMNYFLPTSDDSQPKCPKYDYCEENINDFLQKVGDKISSQSYAYDSENFTKFVDTLKSEIESNFRVDEQVLKKSKRNFMLIHG